MNHLGHEVIAPSLNRESGVLACHSLDGWDGAQAFFGERVVSSQYNRSRGTVPPHQFLRAADVDDFSMLDDRHTVAQSLRLLHQMSGHKHRLSAVAYAAHQIPDRPP